MGKYYNIDPEKCTIDELKAAIQQVNANVELFNNLQLGSKLFINSVYGVFGTVFFNLFNEDIAESITLQGQDLIKFSVEEVNKYFKDSWMSDYDAHNKIASEMKSKYPDFNVDEFLRRASTIQAQFSTLQLYGDTDSIKFDSIIKTKNHPNGITIEDFYNENMNNVSDSTIAGHESVVTNDSVLNWSDKDNLYYGKVKRIIRHKVNKPKWRLKTKSGKEIICTSDHSLIVFRDGVKLSVKPNEILQSDKILAVENV
jgi:hypothetical protein